MMGRRILTALLIPGFCAAAFAGPATRPNRQMVEGLVEDASGRRVANALVFILDGDTGMPYSQVSDHPFRETQFGNEGPPIAFGKTGSDGRFHIRGVFPGTYRLLVQSWAGLATPAELLDKHSDDVALHGVVESLPVVEDRPPAAIAIKPAGSATLKIATERDDLMILVSTQARNGDAILGPLSLAGPFAKNLVGMTYSKVKVVTFSNLPDGKLYVYAMRNDRFPWIAVADSVGKRGETIELKLSGRIYGLEPVDVPPELAWIVELMDTQKKAVSAAVRKALGDQVPRGDDMLAIASKFDVVVDLPGGKRATIRDIMTAQRYRESNREAADRAARQAPPKGK